MGDFRAVTSVCWSLELKTNSLQSGVVLVFCRLLRGSEKAGLGREQNAGAPRKAERGGRVASASKRWKADFLKTLVPGSCPW